VRVQIEDSVNGIEKKDDLECGALRPPNEVAALIVAKISIRVVVRIGEEIVVTLGAEVSIDGAAVSSPLRSEARCDGLPESRPGKMWGETDMLICQNLRWKRELE
jgi:hypothetical protein